MKVLRLIVISLVSAAGLSCGDGSKGVDGGGGTARPPCEILDDELLGAHFDLQPDVEITRSPSNRHHPLCMVRWPKPDAAEIEKKSAEAMQEYIQKKARGEDVELPYSRTTNEVSLTINEPAAEDAGQALAWFDGSMKTLTEGITASHEGVEATFQADVIPVEGVGDKAMWAPKLRQLSVVHGTRIFHVTVNTGAEPDADLRRAKALASDIALAL